MDDWMVVVFVIIAIGVGIIVTVFRKAEEERQRKQQQRPGGVRRPTTDLDRFLEDARRRRGDTAPAVAPPARPAERPWARPVEKPPRRPTDVQRPPAVQRPSERTRDFPPVGGRPATEARQATLARPATLAAPQRQALAPVILEIVPDDEPATVAVSTPATPAVIRTPQAPPPPQAAGILGQPDRTVSPRLKQLQGMLGQPQSIAMAFMLMEIFGPPVSRKRMG